MVRGALALILFAACASTKPGPTKATDVTANPPRGMPRPPCIQPPELDSAISHARVDGTRLGFCVGKTPDQCFQLELVSGILTRLKAPPAAEPSGAHVELATPRLEVCKDKACTSLAPKVMPAMTGLRATTNADGTVAVVLLGDAPAGKGYAEVWDVAAGRRTATFKYARGEFRCGDVRILGDTIYLTVAACGTPAARGTLYSLKGKKIGAVGGKDFGTFGNAFVHVEGTTWAFLEENGNQLVLQDVAKGKVVKTIDVTHLWSADGKQAKDAMGNPGESALVSLGPGQIAVIAGAPSTGKIATIDVATGDVTLTRAPLCN
ncbi:MAG: hypothetical protein JNL83_30655 [Myxococcales bacterium]|nr:hypothetical protein [Myxococcales bacterium]